MRGFFSGPAFPVTGNIRVWGVLFGALATLGIFVTLYGLDLLGPGLILAALYLQGRMPREKIWVDETTIERFLGSVPKRRANKK